MRKQKEHINIGGMIFDVCGATTVDALKRLSFQEPRTIWECYERPSSTKQEIYRDWACWALANHVRYFSVESYNCMIFTLVGAIRIDEQLYTLYITPSYNRAYRVQ